MPRILTLELSDEVYETLNAQAQDTHQTVEEAAACLLSKSVEKPPQNGRKSELPEEFKPLLEAGFSDAQVLSLLIGVPPDTEWTDQKLALLNAALDGDTDAFNKIGAEYLASLETNMAEAA